ncbi:MAG: RNA methyltransferase [Bryobacterales bacterium]|nr:RNA methyltransferase [Bryobacterales bacterium]
MQGLRVVLVSPRNPLNIGAAARAMSNFGFTDLALVNPYDLAFREAQSAVNADHVMQAATVHDTVASAVADCQLIVGTTGGDHRELALPLQRLEQGGTLIRESGAQVALLFGSEKYGLSNDDISHCHWLMRIPARPQHSSMNLGQSVAVCLYELIRSEVPEVLPVAPAASHQQLNVLQERMAEVLALSGYADHTATAGADQRLRLLIGRMGLSRRDAEIWLGVFRQILWKLRH